MNDALRHFLGCGRHRCHRNAHGRFQHFIRQAVDFHRHGGAEKQRLAFHRHGTDQATNGRQEALIEHLISLIQYKRADMIQPRGTLFQMVLQTARGCDQHINTAAKRLALTAKADTAENGRDGKAKMLAIGAEALGDLRRQFARRAQHQHAAATARRAALQQGKLMQQGQRKGRGLAGTGLGNAQQVAPFQHGRNGLGLDGGWGFVALILQSLKEKGVEAQSLEVIGHDES